MKDSILITIPGGITISNFYVTYSYQTNIFNAIPMDNGRFKMSTSCYATPAFYCDSVQPGTCYMDNADIVALACCYPPSCSPQTFYLVQQLARIAGGSGCDTNWVYYSPITPWPFSAYIVGKKASTTTVQ